jgi:hypothetical protein
MFLYWASEDKSRMMIIENGGIEPGTNTVHCIVMDTAYYIAGGYSVRRLASLGSDTNRAVSKQDVLGQPYELRLRRVNCPADMILNSI